MGRTTGTEQTLTAAPAEAPSEFRQRREVGWIFPHGGCDVIASGNGDTLAVSED